MAASILNCISAPCLDYLALQMNHVRPPESRALMEFLARSHAPLRKLRVKTDGAYFVNDCLPYMPALEDLAILRNHGDRNTLWGQEQEVFVSVLHHHWPLVCPLLQTIELDRCAGVDDEWLSRFLRARTDRGSSRGECALRSVKVRFLEPQPSLREVAETTPFTVEGVEVHVRWDEWRPARTYSPGLGASEEEIVNVCEEDRA
ncbi:uncharacterized protein SCHCODRAFT_01039541 [Schizophyllum commune H4-8]|uniref:Expressed protein n=1 Tax=Schizophyllum commune (strain H4-8 / FGSC 9210) TaxID=578458 RepID=D8QI73_SCHCM|nr:uncharacterized protein SCHCODRAFT_01039541 [Schizophyllum commune H4-8]KAI5885889.1 hypothetical protein SCHCODRAFT_01039541 [Schizophyllum commune H4-8]